MRYAKIINNQIVFAPRKVKYNGYTIYNPPASVLLELGYKPVRFTDPPETEEGYHAESYWTETEAEIVQMWNIVPDEGTGENE